MSNYKYNTAAQQTALCFAALVGAVVLYLYYLNVSVVHVVIRKEALHTQSTLEAEIAQLESEFIDAQHAISAAVATRKDYSIAAEKTFITQADTSLVMGGN